MDQNEIQHRFADLTTARVAAAHIFAHMDSGGDLTSVSPVSSGSCGSAWVI